MPKVGKKTLLLNLAAATALALAITLFLTAPECYAKKKGGVEGKIVINFVDVELSSFIEFIGKVTGKNIIYDSQLSGKVTVATPSEIDPEEAFDLFISVLKLKGYTAVFTGAAYRVIPVAEAKQAPMEVYTNERKKGGGEAFVARVIPLAFVQPVELVPVLQPLISREGYIAPFQRSNSIMVIDSLANMDKVLRIIGLLDVEPAGYPPEVVYLKSAQADTVMAALRQIMTARGAWRDTGREGALADKRLNAIVLYGSSKENASYRSAISVLDVPAPPTSSRVNVYPLENADSVETSRVLEGITRQAQAAQAPGAVQDSALKVAITPDKATNSLIIVASPEDFQNLLPVIRKLDRRPRQVYVEAMITEVSINKTLEIGTRWRLAAEKDSQPVFIGGTGTLDTSTVQSLLTGLAGLTAGGLGNLMTVPLTNADGTTTNFTIPGFAAMLSISEFKDAINVLSTPNILTSDNREAEIIVGENVPFLSKLERESSTLNQPVLQSIERKDVGITLRIKPQISEGEYIKLDIYQEISALETSSLPASDIITTKRSAKTSVVVKDGQTVVIGGLIQDREIENGTKVPFLGDLPLIGWLFKTSSREKHKTNLLVFLTPTIVKEFGELDSLTERKRSEFEKKSTTGPRR